MSPDTYPVPVRATDGDLLKANTTDTIIDSEGLVTSAHGEEWKLCSCIFTMGRISCQLGRRCRCGRDGCGWCGK